MKHVTAVLTAAVLMAAAIPVTALELPDSMAQPSLRLELGFGGAPGTSLAQRLHYRLQLDPQGRDEHDPLPTVVALEFTHAGLAEARLGGVPLKATSMLLSQAEEPAPGLRFWKWGLHQWGLVAGAGIIASVLASYEDPSESDPKVASDAESATVGCDDGGTIPPEAMEPGTLDGGCI